MGKIILRGTPASVGVAIGKVKIVLSEKDLTEFKHNDILVAEMTDPSYVLAMTKASGIITESGGVTSHAAIVSREFGIPCIVGVDNLLSTLKDGQKIKIDGKFGEIYENN